MACRTLRTLRTLRLVRINSFDCDSLRGCLAWQPKDQAASEGNAVVVP